MLKPLCFERDMADEIAFHLEHRAEELLASGTPRREAVRQARLDDPISLVTAGFVLAATTAAAGLIPALRSARIDPARALKYE
jgi:hypothetical protein